MHLCVAARRAFPVMGGAPSSFADTGPQFVTAGGLRYATTRLPQSAQSRSIAQSASDGHTAIHCAKMHNSEWNSVLCWCIL